LGSSVYIHKSHDLVRNTADDETIELAEGQVLYRAAFLSVDPYMRIQQAASNTWERPHALNTVQGGGCVGVVVEARCATLNVGDYVSNYSGWQLYVVADGAKLQKLDFDASIPVSAALGVLGMPGRRSCESSRGVQSCSLHSALASLTIHMQLLTHCRHGVFRPFRGRQAHRRRSVRRQRRRRRRRYVVQCHVTRTFRVVPLRSATSCD
jgi:hypothetical protein